MRKLQSVCAAIALGLVVAACGQNQPADQDGDSGAPVTYDEAQDEEQVIRVRRAIVRAAG